MIRVVLPPHLKVLAHVQDEVLLDVESPPTIASILNAMEERYPMLAGTIRDHVTHKRRPFVRFFACEQDFSHVPSDTVVPAAVVAGKEPFLIIGALAGG
ncbi:MAG TPA: hypothetical protein VNR64_19770 [Vicinamibacterales bacterium]|nr:hypothetical protein [Vicinamibacterales bacterium]